MGVAQGLEICDRGSKNCRYVGVAQGLDICDCGSKTLDM